MKVMIVVTHLLGTGHLRRALALTQAFAGRGHDVLLVSGGMPLPGLDYGAGKLVQLAPLQSDGVNFTRLLGADGKPAADALFADRQTALCANLTDFAPDVLITELYPFGRRVLASEFKALLTAAQNLDPRPVVLASIRDILAPPSKPAKAEQTDQVIEQFYDAVLVHSDPQITSLDQSWPVSAALAARLRYTGYVAPATAGPHPTGIGTDEVLVSAGGGPVGTRLFDAALAAARLMPDRHWRLLVGGQNAGERIAAMPTGGPATVEPARPDFRQMLSHVAASVSLCGYNTALDVLQAGTPAVFVPFDDGNEVEQTLRARCLSHLPGIVTLRADDAIPERLCAAVRQVIAAPARAALNLRFDGAAQSVAIAEQMAKART